MYATGIAVLLIGIGISQLGGIFFRKLGVGPRLTFRRGVWWPTHTLKPPGVALWWAGLVVSLVGFGLCWATFGRT